VNIVFCADHRVLPGLHVAAYSLLAKVSPEMPCTRFHLFSDELAAADVELLRRTLSRLIKPFALELHRADATAFAGLPSLNGSRATYYRLFAAKVMDVDRFLYVDADTLCDVELTELESMDLGDLPAAWVPEAPLARAVDRRVAEQLGNGEDQPYFNAGVILVNVPEWRRQRITERAMEYLRSGRADFCDQSALNYVLHQNAMVLDARFNCIANMRKNWPVLRKPYGRIGRLVHFLDYPKPWDLFSEWIYPQYRLWRSVLDRTALGNFRSMRDCSTRKFPRGKKEWAAYGRAAKDRLLCAGLSRGWLKRVKGTGQA
jgi:lipopolysaccharide biosynthesis glycosyltransferase